ncbi:MAG: hypothetical protein LUH82_02510 [Clostridiales bacterium]|nr:hypothetical protein [Clostridiales bacterium]
MPENKKKTGTDIFKNAAAAGIDIKKMKQAAESGKIEDFIDKSLPAGASDKLKSVLSDKASIEKLMSTPQAQELLKKFMKE